MTGGAEANFIQGQGGDDIVRGNGGDDVIMADGRDGSADAGTIDTAQFSGSFSDYTLTLETLDIGFGPVEGVRLVGPDGNDFVGTVEVLDFDGDSANVLIVGSGGFATIQDAVNEAKANDTILIAPGTWTGAGNTGVTIDKPLTITGFGSGSTAADTVIDGGGFIVDMAADQSGGTVLIQNLAIINASGSGISSQDAEVLGTLAIDHVRVEGGTGHGVYATGRQASTAYDRAGVQNVVITNSSFIDNAQSSSNSANIMLFEFDGNATITNVLARNNVTGGSSAAYGVQINGVDGPFYDQLTPAPGSSVGSYDVLTPIGTVTIDGLSVEGVSRKASFYIQGYTDMTGLSVANSTVDTVSGWGKPVIIDPMADQLPSGLPNDSGNAGSFFDETGANGSYNLSGLTVVQNGGQFSELDGTTKADAITGTNANDQITGFEGDDIINAGAGNDTIIYRVGDGQDIIDGGTEGPLPTDADLLIIDNAGSPTATTFTVSQSGGTVLIDTDGNFANAEITATEIEDIQINLGDGGDNVVFATPLTGTSLHTNTITVEGGSGSDSVDASAIDASLPVDIVFNGNGGDDTFTTGAGDDVFVGGADNDTFIYGGNFADATISGSGATLTVSGAYGTDSVTGAEQIKFADTTVLIVDNAAIAYDGAYATIQAAVDAAGAIAGHVTILVADGTYAENVVVGRDDISLVSMNGAGSTIIDGVQAGAQLGAVQLAGGADNVRIGAVDHGFTIRGIDGTPAIEKAAVYLQGVHDNITIQGNDLVARGDSALTAEYGKALTNSVIDSNTFSGQTFNVAPAGNGFGTQFTLIDVPRQLVVISTGSNVTFSKNNVTGTAGGISTTDNNGAPVAAHEQGNTLVTIDSANSTISDNTFTGFTNRYAVALRARGAGTDIENNTLDHTTGGNSHGMEVNNQGVPGTYSGNQLIGGGGDELVYAMTPGADTINGSAGDDTIIWTVGDGADQIDGGGNTATGDTLAVFATAPGQTITLATPGDNGDGFTVSDGAATADVDNVEEVVVNFTAGTGTLDVVGDFAASGIDTSTITVTGGAGVDVVDASLMTSSGLASQVGIEFAGNGGDDSFLSGVGDDSFDGGADTDTATYSGALTASNIATNGLGGWTVTTGGAEGTDTLSNVEIVDGAGAGRFLLVGNGGYATIQDAVDAANAGDTILVGDGTFDLTSAGSATPGQLVIDKDLTIIGQGMASSTIQAVADTGTSGDARGMVLVTSGVTLNVSKLTVDGNGHSIWQGFRDYGSGTFDAVKFTDIQYGSGGPQYNGTAIAVFGGGAGQNVDVVNSVFTDIGRVGVLYFGADVSGNFEGNGYTGKGAGDHLDYALDISAGADVTVVNNTITDNLGVASSDGSISAGVLVTTFFGAGTEATFTGNTFTDNTYGVVAGFDETDASTLGFGAGNSFAGGAGGVSVTGNTVVTGIDLIGGPDGTVNWNGGASVNLIGGADLADTLQGGGGDDIITARGGNDTITWNVGGGRDIVDGGTEGPLVGDADTMVINGDSTAEVFDIYSNDFLNLNPGVAATLGYTVGDAEIVLVRNGVVIAELSEIEEIVINGNGAPAGFADSFVTHGTFGSTNLLTSTITIVGDAGNDIVDLSNQTSDHRIIFQTNGGDDELIGGRAFDLIDITGRTVIGSEHLPDGRFKVTLNDGSTVTTSGVASFVTDADTASQAIINIDPVAVDDTGSGDEDQAGGISGNVFGNDFDANAADILSILAETKATAHGSVTIDALGNYTYTPDADFNGTDSFTYTLNDDHGGSGTGTVEITVNPVNDAPSGADATITLDEDGAHIFAAADFGFTDPVDGDAFESVIITSVPAAGTLKLGGVDVTNGQSIAAADLGNLVFSPAADANGAGYASLGFKVVDDGGTANGGQGTDQSANTLTFDVTPVNDAPVITSDGSGDTASISVAENSTAVTTVTSTDVDGGAPGVFAGFDGSAVDAGIHFDIPNAGVSNITLDQTSGALHFAAAGATNMWSSRANVPIAWAARPNVGAGETWIAETRVELSDAGANSRQVAGLTFYNGDNSTPDFTFGFDTWGDPQVHLQGLGDNTPNASVSIAGHSSVYLKVEISENGATDIYNFFYKFAEGDAWTQLGGAAIDYASSFANDRAGLFYKTEGAKDGASFDYLNVASELVTTYSITGGADANLFDIDAHTGALVFKSAPDFEVRADQDGDNVYDVTVTATDSDGASDTQDIAVTVTDVPEAPTAVNDLAIVQEDGTLLINAADLLNNDVNTPGAQPMSVTGVSGAVNGTVALNAGVITFTPDENFSGQASFTYTIDNGAGTDEATVTVDVAPVADGVQFAAPAPVLSRVSVAEDGTQGNSFSLYGVSVSADGTKVAFASYASNLVAGDGNNRYDVFLKDLSTGTVELVSTTSVGAQANNDSIHGVSVSADGSKVAFASFASNLVAGDFNGSWDVFVKDMTTGAIERVSVSSSETQGNSASIYGVSLSADGTKVAFVSYADNLVGGDVNGVQDVFVRDLTLGTTERVSVNLAGNQGNSRSGLDGLALSADGSTVAYISYATNLVSEDTNARADVFVKNLKTGVVQRASVDAFGAQANGNSDHQLSLSADGTKVAFVSAASNLVAGDTNNTWDVFVKDLTTGAIERVSVAADGAQGNNASYLGVSLSADGTKVAFASLASNLVAGDTNGTWDVFLKDLTTGEITRLSENQNGSGGNSYSGTYVTQVNEVAISQDGSTVVFNSGASNLVDGDTNNRPDYFAARLAAQGLTGTEDAPLAITGISPTLADNDGSETITSLVLSGFPSGATFSAGHADGSTWVFDQPADIAALTAGTITMTPPADYNGAFTLTVTANVTDTAALSTGVATDTTSSTMDLAVTIDPANDAPEITS
ncbi:MAG: tandem-95 repeat protein, partial [Rhodobiaceae bacterium]|nr:tandem-95 repeat protein [Rhodobiaceae bacterium]